MTATASLFDSHAHVDGPEFDADRDAVLARARELGATVLQDKLELPRDIGFIAQIVDSEGNRVGLHSPAA